MKTIALVVLFTTFTILMLTGCEWFTDPDPCGGAKPVEAEFKILEDTGQSGYWFQTDTIRYGSYAAFVSLRKYDSLKWKIGNDDRVFTDSVVSLFFQKPYGSMPIRLIVYRTPNISCFPDDDGIDTLSKYFYITDKSKVYGDYYGSNIEYPKDSFVVTIGYHINPDGNPMNYIHNLNKGCYNKPDSAGLFRSEIPTSLGYMSLEFYVSSWGGSGSLQPRGTGYLDKTMNNIIINYSIRDTTKEEYTRMQLTFKGRRI